MPMYGKFIMLTTVLAACAAAAGRPAVSSSLFAVDTIDYNAGAVREGVMPLTITHTFRIRNTGDSMLRLTSVRPGCGCTTVGFDSIIPPGKTGAVTVNVNAQGFGGGEFHKGVTVEFNGGRYPSVNCPSMRRKYRLSPSSRIRSSSM